MTPNKQTILTIAKKEFQSYFNNPTGYILIVPFLLITYFLYFRQALLTNQASLRSFFDLFPFILLLFAPAIAMRTFSQEQKNNTLELLFAHPITETEIVLGKFFGSLSYYAVLLLSTISLPITLLIFSKPDFGVIVAQYLGALFLGAAFLSIGIAASSFTKTQVSSFLLAVAVNFGFILIGFDMVLLALPNFISPIITQLAILPHADNISRGVLDFRDLLYFLTLISLALTLTVIKLSQRKIEENPAQKNKLNLALILIAAIGLVVNIFMHTFPIRLDLTFNRLFTISKGTKVTLRELPDIVTITLYSSKNLPGQFQQQARKIKDTLRDYRELAKGKIKLIEKYPDDSSDIKTEALQNGIQEIQFNTLANNSFAVAAGYFGLVIQYGGEKEVMPFVQNTEDFEYQLTRRIRKMTAEVKPSISVYTQIETPYGQRNPIGFLNEALGTQYKVQNLDLTDKTASISSQAVLVYGLQKNLGATASAKLTDFVNNGGKLIYLAENSIVNPQAGTVTPFVTGLEKLLADYGVTLNKDLVFDTRNSENVQMGNGLIQYIIPYPLWIKALPNKDFAPVSTLNYVSVAWASSLTLEKVEGVTQTVVLKTSPNAGLQKDKFVIDPQALKPKDLTANSADIGEKMLGVALGKNNSKIVVITDSDFINDNMISQNPQNLDFISSLIDWAASDELIASIKRKTGDSPIFNFTSEKTIAIVQYTNILLPPVIVIGFAVWYLQKRKRLALRKY